MLIYAVVVFIGSALLSPCAYWLVQHFATTFPNLSSRAFHRFVSTTLLVIALGGLWPLLCAIGMNSVKEVGLKYSPGCWRLILTGVLVGLFSLTLVASGGILAGARILNPNLSASKLFPSLAAGILTAIGVAVLEEVLFRGGIFGGLRRVFRWQLALLSSSAIYALMHFLEDTKFLGEVRWWSGLELIPQMFAGSASLNEAAARFTNLALVGILLGLAYQRTGSLWFSIGLHAGWIFWLMSYRLLTKAVPDMPTWFWGTSRLIDGWAALIALILAGLFLRRVPTNPSSDSWHD
jgi:uncharacterized protein